MTKTYLARGQATVPHDVRLDRASLDASRIAGKAIERLTGLDPTMAVTIRAALRHLARHLQALENEPDADTSKLTLKVDVLAAARGVPSL